MTIEEHISFGADELDPTNIYLTLRVAGGETGADIEFQEFSLQISPQDACSTSPPDCQDLVVCNGDAEFGMRPSPFYEKGEVQIRVEIEDGNHFWRVYREEASSVLSGMEWNVPVDCIKEHAVYRFEMRIRVHPDESHPDPITTSVYIRSHRAGSSTQNRVTNCPESEGEWVSCDAYFVITSNMLGDLKHVSMYFETVGTTSTTYDVDDLSFKFVHMEGPVPGLVVGGEVKGKWATGSEILITSHTLHWNDQMVRTIVGLEDYGDDGQVLIELDTPIVRPPSQRSSDFPVEVALLSRNIVFEGGIGEDEESYYRGGHLTVYHTPNVEQIIEGAEFRNFGQQGVSDRYVSW
jgi:hypothetical protein